MASGSATSDAQAIAAAMAIPPVAVAVAPVGSTPGTLPPLGDGLVHDPPRSTELDMHELVLDGNAEFSHLHKHRQHHHHHHQHHHHSQESQPGQAQAQDAAKLPLAAGAGVGVGAGAGAGHISGNLAPSSSDSDSDDDDLEDEAADALGDLEDKENWVERDEVSGKLFLSKRAITSLKALPGGDKLPSIKALARMAVPEAVFGDDSSDDEGMPSHIRVEDSAFVPLRHTEGGDALDTGTDTPDAATIISGTAWSTEAKARTQPGLRRPSNSFSIGAVVPAKPVASRAWSLVRSAVRVAYYLRRQAAHHDTLDEHTLQASSTATRIRRRCMLHPHERLRMFWDVIMVIVILSATFTSPIQFAFRGDARDGNGEMLAPWFAMWEIIHFTICVVDMLVQFRTAVESEYRMLTRPSVVAKHYMKRWFIVDFLCILPVLEISQHSKISGGFDTFARVLRLFRVVRFLKLDTLAASANRLGACRSTAAKVASVTLRILTTAHLLGCAWYFLAKVEAEQGFSNWTQVWELEASDTNTGWYILSLYWSAMTVATVGYGDMQPATNAERAFVILSTFIGSGVFAFMVGKVTALASQLNVSQQVFHEKMDAVNEFMHVRHIPSEMRTRIRDYYSQFWSKGIYYNEHTILGDLTFQLQQDVQQFLNQDLLQRVPFFKKLPRDCVSLIISKFRQQHAMPNDIITKFGDKGGDMYVVRQGILVVKREGHDSHYLTRGAFFGEVSLVYPNLGRTATIVCEYPCSLAVLNIEDFTEICRLYPIVFQVMKATADAHLDVDAGTRPADKKSARHLNSKGANSGSDVKLDASVGAMPPSSPPGTMVSPELNGHGEAPMSPAPQFRLGNSSMNQSTFSRQTTTASDTKSQSPYDSSELPSERDASPRDGAAASTITAASIQAMWPAGRRKSSSAGGAAAAGPSHGTSGVSAGTEADNAGSRIGELQQRETRRDSNQTEGSHASASTSRGGRRNAAHPRAAAAAASNGQQVTRMVDTVLHEMQLLRRSVQHLFERVEKMQHSRLDW